MGDKGALKTVNQVCKADAANWSPFNQQNIRNFYSLWTQNLWEVVLEASCGWRSGTTARKRSARRGLSPQQPSNTTAAHDPDRITFWKNRVITVWQYSSFHVYDRKKTTVAENDCLARRNTVLPGLKVSGVGGLQTEVCPDTRPLDKDRELLQRVLCEPGEQRAGRHPMTSTLCGTHNRGADKRRRRVEARCIYRSRWWWWCCRRGSVTKGTVSATLAPHAVQ